jgi:hypothetical protein
MLSFVAETYPMVQISDSITVHNFPHQSKTNGSKDRNLIHYLQSRRDLISLPFAFTLDNQTSTRCNFLTMYLSRSVLY